MILLIKAGQEYIRRPLPPVPYLLEEPRAATAALEAAIQACPTPSYFGKYAFSTGAQRYDLGATIDTPYLTYREAVWVELWRYEFDTNTAAQVLTQLQHIIAHRKASGITPMLYKGRCFFPERPTPLQP